MQEFEILFDAPESLRNKLDEGAFVVDVRTPEEFLLGSYPGAVNIPLLELYDRWEELKSEDDIIVYCRSGHRSDQAKKFLLQQGASSVLNGGNHLFLEKISGS